jgi:hypothetical protein
MEPTAYSVTTPDGKSHGPFHSESEVGGFVREYAETNGEEAAGRDLVVHAMAERVGAGQPLPIERFL